MVIVKLHIHSPLYLYFIHLHSSMVIVKLTPNVSIPIFSKSFTFQYGYSKTSIPLLPFNTISFIYIPVWL